MMDAKEKQRYIDDEVLKLTQVWMGKVIFVAVFVFFMLAAMDYFVVPQFFKTFLVYRIRISIILAVFYLLNKLWLNRYYQYTVLIIGTILSAGTIELMIVKMGAHTSVYYAGLNLTAIAVLGFIPMGLVTSFLTVAVIYVIYLLPILLFDTISNTNVFISNNSFMVATAVIALSWRVLVQKRLVSEIGLQYDLSLEQAKLENLVTERTSMYMESEHSYRSLFQNATDGILVVDQRGVIIKANENANKMHSFQEDSLIGTNIHLLEREQHREKLAQAFGRVFRGEGIHYETEHYRKDGSLINVEASANLVELNNTPYVQLIVRDITEKKKIQDHLIQSQKMESVATLAGGIAHDLNNVLTGILGYSDVIRRKIDDETGDAEVINGVNIIERAARNGARMISQLMDFARRKKPETRPTNINDTITDTAKLLERTLPKNVHIDLKLDPGIPHISGDITHLSQAVMNLVVNARDAMPAGGVITLSTLFLPRDSVQTYAPPYVTPADYVVVKVADTGTGIPDDVKAKMFEPFFTTKEQGKGTGLGLAMVYSVVTNHRGFISMTSQVNKGTTFTLYFPALDMDVTRRFYAGGGQLRPNQKILVIEDDQMNLNFIKDTLEREKFSVTATQNPLAALDLLRNSKDSFSLVITDLRMPLMTGDELIGKIREIKPDQRVIVITGNAAFEEEERGKYLENPLLRKPFDSATLLSNVKRVILA